MSIIEIEHVTKEFKLGQLTTLKQATFNAVRRLTGKPAERKAPFKALNDVTFSVERGEVLGIIGTNGAGKSTLLKLMARISVPTQGRVAVNGTVAPLIEVGAGLVPDLTGRENIFLNGAILGLRRAEIRRKFDEIVAFAELEKFIDTPLKRYSSGMSVRLGFAIATSVESDILIVDEVLAVGDLAFQRKCFDRMDSIIKDDGRTVLVVTHNLRQVDRICTRAIFLDKGITMADGNPEDVCSMFLEQTTTKIADERKRTASANSRITSSGEIELRDVNIIDRNGCIIDAIPCNGELRVRVRFAVRDLIENPQIIVGTHTTDFVYLNAGSTGSFVENQDLAPGLHEVEYTVPNFPLAPGVYCVRFSVYDRHLRPVFIGESLSTFRVLSVPAAFRDMGTRTLQLPGYWVINGRPMDAEAALSH